MTAIHDAVREIRIHTDAANEALSKAQTTANVLSPGLAALVRTVEAQQVALTYIVSTLQELNNTKTDMDGTRELVAQAMPSALDRVRRELGQEVRRVVAEELAPETAPGMPAPTYVPPAGMDIGWVADKRDLSVAIALIKILAKTNDPELVDVITRIAEQLDQPS